MCCGQVGLIANVKLHFSILVSAISAEVDICILGHWQKSDKSSKRAFIVKIGICSLTRIPVFTAIVISMLSSPHLFRDCVQCSMSKKCKPMMFGGGGVKTRSTTFLRFWETLIFFAFHLRESYFSYK